MPKPDKRQQLITQFLARQRDLHAPGARKRKPRVAGHGPSRNPPGFKPKPRGPVRVAPRTPSRSDAPLYRY